MTQEEFETLFNRFGPVTSAAVSFDEEGKSRGFGFVNFESHEELRQRSTLFVKSSKMGANYLSLVLRRRLSVKRNYGARMNRRRWRR